MRLQGFGTFLFRYIYDILLYCPMLYGVIGANWGKKIAKLGQIKTLQMGKDCAEIFIIIYETQNIFGFHI